MNSLFLTILGIFGALALGSVIGYYVRQSIARRRAGSIEAKLQEKLIQTKKEAAEILSKAQEKADKLEKRIISELDSRQQSIIKTENLLLKREEILENKHQDFEKKERDLSQKVERVKEIKESVEALKIEAIKSLEQVAGLSAEEAKNELLEKIEKEYQVDVVARIRKLEARGQEQYEKRAKEILAQAIQGFALPQSQELTTSTITLPSDEIKGRIIGKEGRNIRVLEKMTGVELIVDETPETVILSCFNPVRREIARVALERLIKDGRIQPARIEAEIEKAQGEVAKKVKEAGEAAVYDTDVLDLPEKLIQVLGRLHYRTSYGQNVLLHSMEVSRLAAALASELDANVSLCKKAGLLHDIGKALDWQVEGSHTDIGVKILEKFKVSKDVISAMRSHHEEYPYESIEAIIVQVADQISGARPGARKDTLENYLKRLEELEGVATSFAGIKNAFAIQAGREIRVFVRPEEIDDLAAHKLAKDIARKIQEELKYPGEIKVNVIRELRITEYAK
ncbi:MAG: ribonuclease Y [Candidatus Paceibacterota bacterium]|jgi:ribonuclease Y